MPKGKQKFSLPSETCYLIRNLAWLYYNMWNLCYRCCKSSEKGSSMSLSQWRGMWFFMSVSDSIIWLNHNLFNHLTIIRPLEWFQLLLLRAYLDVDLCVSFPACWISLWYSIRREIPLIHIVRLFSRTFNFHQLWMRVTVSPYPYQLWISSF